MSLYRMKPLLFILGAAIVMACIGWTWSELPKQATLFAPVWTPSYHLYGQPHAVWLNRYDRVGANIESLTKVLKAASKAHQIPELVVYAIPMRDLGQSSEGGFANYEDYLADNRLNADVVKHFVKATGLRPVIYLEPDSLPLAVQYRRDHYENKESLQIYADRVRILRTLIDLYKDAGAIVFLEAGHSGWFDYGKRDVQRIADALNAADIEQADGLATNVSNRQPVVSFQPDEQTEVHYLRQLLPRLKNPDLLVAVDTSRNGGSTHARQYYLHPDGRLIDNETAKGRLVGHWQPTVSGDIELHGFFGKVKKLSRLTDKEKYSYDSRRNVLTAPAWLDAVGDVQPGPPPTDHPPSLVSDAIGRYRYIKPPDDCDGAINYPPGASKRAINTSTAERQPHADAERWQLPAGIWQPEPQPSHSTAQSSR